MSKKLLDQQICVVIGASHAGVNLAFSLRKEGWKGSILLFDTDPELPYHRPPLSKTYLTNDDATDKNLLKSGASYQKEEIDLHLGITVTGIDRAKKQISLEGGQFQSYDILIIATGARAFIPPIPGIHKAKNVFPLRTALDVEKIKKAIKSSNDKEVVVIGGGYIGLETAASLKKMGVKVTVLEREDRVLARVTAPEMSSFFNALHAENGVEILTQKNVTAIEKDLNRNKVICSDGTYYTADLILVGVGIQVNTELAEKAGLAIKNGIAVDHKACTNDPSIFAIGDCTFHYNPHYDRYIRLESVQNAIDQAKIAAAAICGKDVVYDTLPWFWSDQYTVKLQMVGLSEGYDEAVVRKENGAQKSISIWYFKKDILLAVDAINNAKAYVLGTKFIKNGQKIDKIRLQDPETPFKPAHLTIP